MSTTEVRTPDPASGAALPPRAHRPSRLGHHVGIGDEVGVLLGRRTPAPSGTQPPPRRGSARALAERWTAAAPAEVRAGMSAGRTPPPAITCTPGAAATIAAIAATPSAAVGAPPEVRTRVRPSEGSSAAAATGSADWSMARCRVMSTGRPEARAASASLVIATVSRAPSAVSAPITTPEAPEAMTDRTSAAISVISSASWTKSPGRHLTSTCTGRPSPATASTRAADGVRPPSSRAMQSSTRSAPFSRAARAPAGEVTAISRAGCAVTRRPRSAAGRRRG